MDKCCEPKKCGCSTQPCTCAPKACGCKEKDCGCMGKEAANCKSKDCDCKKNGHSCKGKDCGCKIKDCDCKKMAGEKNMSSGAPSGNGIKTISADELLKKMKSEPDLIVVNVLSEDYYHKCHIKDSINVPLAQLQSIASESWNKNDKIVVYCANYECPASRNAFKLLEKLGFTHVCAYEGGIKEWCQKGYPIVGECAV